MLGVESCLETVSCGGQKLGTHHFCEELRDLLCCELCDASHGVLELREYPSFHQQECLMTGGDVGSLHLNIKKLFFLTKQLKKRRAHKWTVVGHRSEND